MCTAQVISKKGKQGRKIRIMMESKSSKYKNACRQTVKLIPEDNETWQKTKVDIKLSQVPK